LLPLCRLHGLLLHGVVLSSKRNLLISTRLHGVTFQKQYSVTRS
jgi:hypothetical protein